MEGECVENSSTESGASPILTCEEMGQWRVIKPCLCNPGYELDSSQDMCSGMARGFFYLRMQVHVLFPQSVQRGPSHQEWVMDWP